MEGRRATIEALSSPAAVVEVFVDPGAPGAPEIEEAAAERRVPVIRVARRVIEAISDTQSPQAAVAIVAHSDVPVSDLGRRPGLVVVLANVRDPGNAGTLVRSAAAAGAAGVVFSSGSVDPYHPKTVRAAAAALFHIPVARDVSLDAAIGALRDAGRTIVGADARAARSHRDVDWSRPAALVLGNEAWGIGPPMRDLLDDTVGIPMPGPVESLNVGIAGSVILFEAARRFARHS